MTTTISVSPWTHWVLRLAAIYNLLWGLMIIFIPTQPFLWAGLEPPTYVPIIQCLGMVIGVYGIGYWIAASDPARHWPIVFVGLLGKLFGPIGFLYYALQGQMPWVLGLTILTNDLIWWLPFVAILVQAVRVNDYQRLQSQIHDREAEMQRAIGSQGISLLDLSRQSKVLVVFLRHSGCTYCRETLATLSQQQDQLQAKGFTLAIVHMGPPAEGERLAKQFALPSAHWFSDPNRHLYHVCDLELGTLNELLGPFVFWRALIGGAVFRYGIGPMVGNGLQLSGAFVIHQGKILGGVRHRSTAETTNFVEVCRV